MCSLKWLSHYGWLHDNNHYLGLVLVCKNGKNEKLKIKTRKKIWINFIFGYIQLFSNDDTHQMHTNLRIKWPTRMWIQLNVKVLWCEWWRILELCKKGNHDLSFCSFIQLFMNSWWSLAQFVRHWFYIIFPFINLSIFLSCCRFCHSTSNFWCECAFLLTRC